jgi:hypothetical protein
MVGSGWLLGNEVIKQCYCRRLVKLFDVIVHARDAAPDAQDRAILVPNPKTLQLTGLAALHNNGSDPAVGSFGEMSWLKRPIR